jgi:hypothetical protein
MTSFPPVALVKIKFVLEFAVHTSVGIVATVINALGAVNEENKLNVFADMAVDT